MHDCAFVTRDTLFWRKNAFYLYIVIICEIKKTCTIALLLRVTRCFGVKMHFICILL